MSKINVGCDEMEINCEWDDWQIGDCSKSCGGGTLTKTRTKKVLEKNGGKECPGSSTFTESCNIQECPGKLYIHPLDYKSTHPLNPLPI